MKIKRKGARKMTIKRLFLGLNAFMLVLSMLLTPITYVFADNTVDYHVNETYNVDGVKQYFTFGSKNADGSYNINCLKNCYIYGYTDDTNFSSINYAEEDEAVKLCNTSFNDTCVGCYDYQSDYKSYIEFFIKAKGDYNYFSANDLISVSDYNALSESDKAKYEPYHYVYAGSGGMIYSEDEYNALSSDNKNGLTKTVVDYGLVKSATFNNEVTLISDMLNSLPLYLDSVKTLIFLDESKNYIGSVKVSDVSQLMSANAYDETVAPSLSVTGAVADYINDAHDGVWIDFTCTLSRVDDGIQSISLKSGDTLSSMLFSYDIVDNNTGNLVLKARVKQYLDADATLVYVVESKSGLKQECSVQITGIGVVAEDENPEGADTEDIKNAKNPVVTFSDYSKKTTASSINITMKTNNVATIMSFNGATVSKYKKSNKFTIYSNGTYYYTAITKDGKETRGSINVKCFKKPVTEGDDTPLNNGGSVYFDSANSQYDESLLPSTGATPIIVIIAVLVIIVGVVLIVKGGKLNVNKK